MITPPYEGYQSIEEIRTKGYPLMADEIGQRNLR